MQEKDKSILRNLATKIAEISQLDIMAQRKKDWLNLNSLRGDKPMILVSPEGAWREIKEQITFETSTAEAQEIEWNLKQKLYHYSFGDDTVFTNNYTLPFQVTMDTWGVKLEKSHSEMDTGAYKQVPPLNNLDEDFAKLRYREISVNHELYNQKFEVLHELFDGILNITPAPGYNFWTCGLTWTLIDLIGMDNLLFGMYDEPENIHKILNFLSEDCERTLKQFEAQNLLYYNNGANLIGSGNCGYIDCLASQDNPVDGQIKIKDLWGLAESQETVGVSPDMFGEFIWPYQKRLMELFGVSYYGCCEPINERLSYVKEAKNLRALSISPWANIESSAEQLGRDYVLSHKVNPATLCVKFIEPEVRKELNHRLEVCKGLNNMFILKDTHTISNEPERFTRWINIAREEIDKVYK